MVKSICYTLAAILLCLGIFIYAEIFLNRQFEEFSKALDTLYTKVENRTATREDGYAQCGTTKSQSFKFWCRTTTFLTSTIGLASVADFCTTTSTSWRWARLKC